MNNLICAGENKKEITTVFFEDNENYSFKGLKEDPKKSKAYIKSLEDIFYSKFPKSEGYYIDFSTIVKGSIGVVLNTNLTKTQFDDFLKTVNQNKKYGAISSTNTQLKFKI